MDQSHHRVRTTLKWVLRRPAKIRVTKTHSAPCNAALLLPKHLQWRIASPHAQNLPEPRRPNGQQQTSSVMRAWKFGWLVTGDFPYLTQPCHNLPTVTDDRASSTAVIQIDVESGETSPKAVTVHPPLARKGKWRYLVHAEVGLLAHSL